MIQRTPIVPSHRLRGGLVGMLCSVAAACTGSAAPPAEPVVAMSAAEPSPCAREYHALLDLAVLARSYGPNAGVFMSALGELVDQLDACLSEQAPDGGTETARGADAALMWIGATSL